LGSKPSPHIIPTCKWRFEKFIRFDTFQVIALSNTN
jgi:hypothetical protein